MKKCFSLISHLLFIPLLSTFSQIAQVMDKSTFQPLGQVCLYSLNPATSAITDYKGQTEISGFKNIDSVYIRLIGYKEQILSYNEIKKNDFKIFLSQINITLDEIIVSATRWQQEKKQIPVKVLSVKQNQVEMQNPQTMADLINTTGYVFVQKSQLGGGSPMIRGFATNRVFISVDGVRMNNAIFRSGNIQNIISLDPFIIEKAEVIFGPGSVVYGSDAIGGVMSFYTLSPVLSASDKWLIRINSATRWSSANNENTGHIDLSFGHKRWAFTSSVTYSDFNDLKMGSNGPDAYLRPYYASRINNKDTMLVNTDALVQKPSGYSQLNLMQKVKFRLSEKWEFNFGFHCSNTSDYSRYDRHIRYRDNIQRSAEWYYGPQIWIMDELNVSNTGKNLFYDKSNILLAHQYFKESRHDRDFGDNTLYHRFEEVNAYSLNYDFEKLPDENNHIYYGIESVVNSVGSVGKDEDITDGTQINGPSRYPDGSVWNSNSVYINYSSEINPVVNVQGGLRYNKIFLSASFDTSLFNLPFTETHMNTDAISGSLGISILPTGKWQLNFNVSSGFRAPNIDDMGKIFDSEPGSVVVPNKNLKPEYAWNFETGVIKLIDDIAKVDITGYYTILDNALVRRNYVLNGQDSVVYGGEMSGVQAMQNAAGAYVYGVQAGINLILFRWIEFTSNYNFQKGEEELDDGSVAPLRHAAPWFGSTSITYNSKKIKLMFYTVYNGEVSYKNLASEEQGKGYLYSLDKNGNPYSPAWYTLNFKCKYNVTANIKMSAGIENITDQRYKPYSSGIAAAGRNFIVSLIFKI